MKKLDLVYSHLKDAVTAQELAGHFPSFSMGTVLLERVNMVDAINQFWRLKVVDEAFRAKIVKAKFPYTAHPKEITTTGEWKVNVKVLQGKPKTAVQAFQFTLFIVPNPREWSGLVVCADKKTDVDETLAAKIEAIAEDGGRKAHGGHTAAIKGKACLHWPSGELRIFGYFAGDQLHVVGIGRHKGKASDKYSVTLCGTKESVDVTLA